MTRLSFPGIFLSAVVAFSLCSCSNSAKKASYDGSKAAETVSAAKVLSGLDVLERDGFRQLEGKRIGIITNHSSVNLKGENAVDVLYRAKNVRLVKIFSPEHGFRGVGNEGARIENSTDDKTGLPIVSLYGKNRLRPTPEMLEDIDAIVFDIQDIGARFYTYLTTMGYAMEEAAKAKKQFIVLDRPNPIGGIMEGPLLEDDISIFTAYYRVPTRHGLTAGEMALFHKGLHASKTPMAALDLTIIKAEGWTRDMFFNETGIKWTNPSPNIRDTDAEVLYPGIGCFEASNLSVGRGTDNPFLWFGAPWLDGKKLAEQLNAMNFPGVRFSSKTLTPSRSVYSGKECGGVEITVTAQKSVRSMDIMAWAAYYLNKNHPNDFVFREKDIRDMTGNGDLYKMIQSGETPEKLLAQYRRESAGFNLYANKFRLYKQSVK